MNEIFKNKESTCLPTRLGKIEKEIMNCLKSITTRLLLMEFQMKVKNIHLAGAITNVAYFSNTLCKLMSKHRMDKIIRRMSQHFKPEYKNAQISNFEFSCESACTSVLLEGAHSMIETSAISNISIPTQIECKHSNVEDYCPGLLQYDEQTKTYSIRLLSNIYDMYSIQDFEIYILKFSNLIDTSTIDVITEDNYEHVGVTEFIRFTNLEIWADPTTIETTNHQFFVKLALEKEFLKCEFFYTHKGSYYKSILKIERHGRMERIPVNDAKKIIFTKENDTRTWYGLDYTTFFLLSRNNKSSVRLIQKRAQMELAEHIYTKLKPEKTNGKYICTGMSCISDGDIDRVLKEVKRQEANSRQ